MELDLQRTQKRAQRLLLHLTTPNGVTLEQWAITKQSVRREIWQRASKGVHHGDVAKAVGMRPVGNRWYRLLDEACLEVVAAAYSSPSRSPIPVDVDHP